MANAIADQALSDQLADAFSVDGTRVVIRITDTGINFQSTQSDTADVTKIKHGITIASSNEALITAFIDALVATGRPA